MTTTLTTTQKIFGREPAIWVGLVQAFVTMVIMFGLPITTEQGALIVAVFNGGAGAYLAYKVRPIAVGSIVAFIQSGVALLVGFGLNLTTDQQGVLLTFVALLLNVMIVRPNVEPQVSKAEPIGADGISGPAPTYVNMPEVSNGVTRDPETRVIHKPTSSLNANAELSVIAAQQYAAQTDTDPTEETR